VQYNRVFRTLALALIFALLVLPLAATPAPAQTTPVLTLTPASGMPGTIVTVTGTDFDAVNNKTVYILFKNEYTHVSVDVTNGTFTTTFTVPSDAAAGTASVTVQYGTWIYPPPGPECLVASASFVVLKCQITLSPSSGGIGDTVTVSGTGFDLSSNVTIYFDSATAGTATTDTSGNLADTTFTVPQAPRGNHTIKVQDAKSNYATATFTVTQKITITPTSGAPGKTVTVTGKGFGAAKTVTIKYNAEVVSTNPTTVNTDGTGSFTASFTVPTSGAGTYVVEASDGTYTASANFAITINANLSQTTTEASPGHVGMEITMSGTGFKPNTQIKITYTSAPIVVATVNSNDEGAFSATFKIPKSEHGTHTITASDGTNTLQATFIMEQAAPAIPTLLLPANEAKAKSRPVFEWENVAKDINDADELSVPVTYDLQIASDADFSNIVLEKTALPTSGYALLKAETLESTEKEAPYYWRVRAVDAASNTGDWTDPRTFYVSGSDWGLYALIGAGVLVIFFLGFWAGRKSKRSEYY
jgi:hypothetical protein